MKTASAMILAVLSMICTQVTANAATTPKEMTKVSLCVPFFREEFLTLAAIEAKDRGFFAAHGLDVNITAVTQTKGVHSHMLKQGEIPHHMMDDFSVADKVGTATCEFGTSNVERFLSRDGDAQNKTQPLMISSYGETYDTQLVVAANSKITSIKDLKGKRIRMGQAPVRMALEKILVEGGLKLSDIKEDYGTKSTAVLAKLESGELDAAVTYVPTMPYMLASGKIRVLKSNIVKNYLSGQIPHSLVIVNRTFATTSPDVVKRFVAAIKDSNEYLRRNPSESIYVMQRNAEMLGHGTWTVDKTIAEKAAEFVGKINAVDLFESSTARTETLAELKTYAELLKTHGLLKQELDLAHWLGVSSKNPSRVSSL